MLYKYQPYRVLMSFFPLSSLIRTQEMSQMETITLPDLIQNSGNIYNSIPAVDTNFPHLPLPKPFTIDSMLDKCVFSLVIRKLGDAFWPPPRNDCGCHLSLPWSRDGFGPALRGHYGDVSRFRARCETN